MKKLFFACVMIAFASVQLFATVRTATTSGNWNTPAIWGGTVPATNDDVVINAGVTVTINVNPNNIKNVTISGSLLFDATGTGRSWTVTQNFTINSGGTFGCVTSGTATTHSLTYNGATFTNNGTFNLVNSTNKCNVTLSSSASQVFSGNALMFNKLTVNQTSGKFKIVYAGGTFTPSEVDPVTFNTGITTLDSMVIKQGLVVGCGVNNATISHTFANFKLGGSGAKITSSVDAFSGSTTITVNAGMILNDATNSNVSMTVLGSFISPSMTQSNAATAFGIVGPNCQGGANNATSVAINGDWNMTDIFVCVGNTKVLGGVEPSGPAITCSGNISWLSSETHTIDIPFTSDDFILKTCYFGAFDNATGFPTITLNGGTVSVPKTFSIAFDVFDAPVQTSSPLGMTTVAQISESETNWTVNGNWKILSGASLAIHSDDILTVNGSLRIASGGEIAGSETETDPTGYVPVTGPTLSLGANGIIYVENLSGLGKGTLAEAGSNVAFKNRTADIDWDLSNISTSGTVEYVTNSQTITEGTYNDLQFALGTKTLANNITVNGNLGIGITIVNNAGFNITALNNVTNDGTHSGTGRIILSSTSNQFISGNGDWGNMEINNAAGVTCIDYTGTNGLITLTLGNINIQSGSVLALTSTGSITSGSATSYVSGPMLKTTTSTTAFLFPIGKGGSFQPLTVTPTSNSSTLWTAEFFNTPYSSLTPVTAPITSVNNVVYWQLDRSGSADATVKLQWNTLEGLTDLNGLTVAHWSGSAWTDAGATSTTGTTSSGTITSATASSFGPFTLGELNTIATGTISGSPFCPLATFQVPFTSVGTFNAGNVYTAQISNATGSFAAPINIGTLTSTANAGNISAALPSNAPAGTAYRIRVVSNNPAVIPGTDNGTNLGINSCAKPTALTASNVTNSSVTLSWTGPTCGVQYTVQYKKSTQANGLQVTVNGTTANITGLVANTTYNWRVRTKCGGTSKSGFQNGSNFTTLARLGEEETTPFAASVFPNPTDGNFSVSVTGLTENEEMNADVYDVTGRLVLHQSLVADGATALLNFSLPASAGMYFVRVQQGEHTCSQVVVKE